MDPEAGVADLMYGYSERDDVAELQTEPTIPVSIDTPFNVLGVCTQLTLISCITGGVGVLGVG